MTSCMLATHSKWNPKQISETGKLTLTPENICLHTGILAFTNLSLRRAAASWNLSVPLQILLLSCSSAWIVTIIYWLPHFHTSLLSPHTCSMPISLSALLWRAVNVPFPQGLQSMACVPTLPTNPSWLPVFVNKQPQLFF